MKMKKLIMFLFLSMALPLSMLAQDDDMYFVPTKENKAKEAENYGMPSRTYYVGSSRSVDDYNRRSMIGVNPTDSVGNDIIDFSAVRGVYPDSTYTEMEDDGDYQLTRRMSRFDDYTPSQAYWEGYRDGRWASPWSWSYSSLYWNDYWYWNDPWYWNSSWYWRYPYYSGYYGYYPWYTGYYGYYGYGYRPWYYGGGIYISTGGGHRTNGRPTNHRPRLNGNNYGGYRDNSTRTSTTNTSRGTNFGGSRSTSTTSSGSFGGSRGGGSFGGGGGGGRSASGGRSYGGRR